MVISVPLPNPGSVLKKYSQAINLGLSELSVKDFRNVLVNVSDQRSSESINLTPSLLNPFGNELIAIVSRILTESELVMVISVPFPNPGSVLKKYSHFSILCP